MVTLYGIPNCSTVKKARTWLEQHGIEYAFHDYKKMGITKARLDAWCKAVGFEVLVNQKGTTWRALPDARKLPLTKTLALTLMIENPSLIKRPVVEQSNTIKAVGFNEDNYNALFK